MATGSKFCWILHLPVLKRPDNVRHGEHALDLTVGNGLSPADWLRSVPSWRRRMFVRLC